MVLCSETENTPSYKYVLSKANFQQFGLPKLAIVAAKSANEKRVFWLPTLVLRFKQVMPSGKNSLKEEELLLFDVPRLRDIFNTCDADNFRNQA